MGNEIPKNSILVTHNRGADYRFLLPGYSPTDVSNMIWRSIDAEGNILVSDPGRLPMHIATQALKNKDARLLGGSSLKQHIHHNVGHVYFLSRPERSLQFDMRSVLWNDQAPFLQEDYRGPFFGLKTYLHRIAEEERNK